MKVSIVCIFIIFVGLCINSASETARHSSKLEEKVDKASELKRLSGKVPLHFIANKGQVDDSIIYYANGERVNIFCTEEGIALEFAEGVIWLKFSEKQVRPEARGELTGKINYFIGNNPTSWQTNIPAFNEIAYRNVYPGIDLIYSGDRQRLKYTFYLQPESDPDRIQIIYEGAESIRVDETTGDLIIRTGWGDIRDSAPVAYQNINGVRKPVGVSFRLIDKNCVGFTLGDYDQASRLEIDPSYSTCLCGTNSGFDPGHPSEDSGESIAVDSSGNAYITGGTNASDFLTNTGAYQRAYGGGMFDAFVTKLTSTGTLVYSTYLGGTGYDFGEGIVVDSSGNAYVAGIAGDSFPVLNAIDSKFDGQSDAFTAKLSSTGSLVYSTYLGGSNVEQGRDIAIDSSGNTYITGYTRSSDFPTMNAYSINNNGKDDIFITKISSAGNTIIYSTYLGGSEADYPYGIAVDNTGNAYVTGETHSSDFPSLKAYDSTFNGGTWDVFVARIDTTQNSTASLIYFTYLGGDNEDHAYSIALDDSKNAYIAGYTASSNFPTINKSSLKGANDAFVAKLSSNGDAIVYSTYLGGSKHDYAHDIAIDSSGNAYVTGYTDSADFPVNNAYDSSHNGLEDAFITVLSSSEDTIIYSTFLGGYHTDYGLGIALGGSDNVYVTGNTSSPNFPVANALRGYSGSYDAFVTSFSVFIGKPPVVTLPDNITFPEDGANNSIDLDDYVTDADNADEQIIWTYTGNTNVYVAINSNTRVVTFTARPDWRGSETVTFIGTDPGGLNSSDTLTVTVTPVNDPPAASDLSITPSFPDNSDNLTGSYKYQDIEGDKENASEIRWYKDGILQSAYNDVLSIPSSATLPGEKWYFTIKPEDGMDFGNMQTSPFVIIGRILLSIPSVSRSPGSTVLISIEASDTTGLGIIAANLTLTYDAGILSPKGVVVLGTMAKTWMVPVYNTGKPGQIVIGIAGVDPLIGSGVLLSINFDVSDTSVIGSTSRLELINVSLNSGNVPFALRNGVFTVSASGKIGDVSGDNTVSSYDAAMVLQNSVGLNHLSPQQQVLADVNGDKNINAYSAALILQHSLGLITKFPTESQGNPAPDMRMPANAQPFNAPGPGSVLEISIPELSGKVNDIITIPILVSNTSGLGIIGADITVTYDPEILTPSELVMSGTIVPATWMSGSNPNSPGQVKIAIAGTRSIEGSGTLAQIKFSVSKTAGGKTCPLRFSRISINESTIPASIINGAFIVDSTVTVTYAMEPGWNLISMPIQPSSKDPATVLQPISGKYQSVFAYEGDWKYYIPGAPSEISTLKTFEPGKGYWINMTEKALLTYTGCCIIGAKTQLRAGWNLVGYCCLMTRNVEEVLSSISGKYQSIFGHDGEWKYYISGAPPETNTLKTTEPGKGYWINAITACVWSMDSTESAP